VIYGKVPETAKHERIISLVLIGVDDAPATDLFDGQAKKGLGFAARNDLDKYLAGPGENAENRDLTCGAAAAFAFALAAEIGFVKFYFTGKESFSILFCEPVSPSLLSSRPCGPCCRRYRSAWRSSLPILQVRRALLPSSH